jgi:6-phosphogluconolactonase
MAEVMVFPDKHRLAEHAGNLWVEICRRSSGKGAFNAVLSGGETPKTFYRHLAARVDSCPWDRAHIYFADERFVPFDHPDSNYGMIRDILLDKLPVRPAQVHPVPVDEVSPELSAMRYERDIRDAFGLPDGMFPSFDIALLGLGEDGHTASLFPGAPVLDEKIRIAAPAFPEKAPHGRITLTLPVLNRAKAVIFLVTGKRKAAALAGTLAGKRDVPAARIKPQAGRLFFLLDEDAASGLAGKNRSGGQSEI